MKKLEKIIYRILLCRPFCDCSSKEKNLYDAWCLRITETILAQAEEAINNTRLTEEEILEIVKDWWEKEKKGKTLGDLAHSLYSAQTKKLE